MKTPDITASPIPTISGLTDTHCHLDMDVYTSDLTQVITDAKEAGVDRIVSIGIDLKSSHRAVSIANEFTDIYATIGIHPHNASEVNDQLLLDMVQLANYPTVVGYGEIGLDYVKNYAPKQVQQHAFSKQLLLAKKLALPIIIHDREAHEDTLTLLEQIGPFPAGGVMHCFSGDLVLAEKIIAMGLYISIPGIVTFNSAGQLQDVVRKIDLKHILLETDGPFLAPVPFRGKRNAPGLLPFIAQKVADLKGISIQKVSRVTTTNAERLFKLPPH